LAKQDPDSELYFIIGADNLAKMEEWHHPEKIFATAHVVVGQRPGAKPAACRFEQQMLKINIPPLDISSTQIRNLARAGRPIADLVPPAVAEYIARERLYV